MLNFNRVFEVDAGKNCKDIRLNKGNKEFKADHDDVHRDRENGAQPGNAAGCCEHDTEARDNFEHNVTGDHVREKTNGEGDRAAQERNEFDQHNEREHPHRNIFGHEEAEKMRPVTVDTDKKDCNKDHHGQGSGNGQMACVGK